MTGDGVNDAPALNRPISASPWDGGGTEVAKGAADMVLTDDNFATIETAVEEGRCVFDNLTKFIVWTLPTNIGESMIVLVAIYLGVTLPVLPIQLLSINMATAVLLGMTLAFETREPGLMERPPRDPHRPLLTFPLFMRSGLVSLLTLAGAFGLLWGKRAWCDASGSPYADVANVIVFVQLFYLFNCRSLIRPSWSLGAFSNRWLLAGCNRDDRRAVGFHLRTLHERSISLRTARWSRMAACYRSCTRGVANGWVRESRVHARAAKSQAPDAHARVVPQLS